MQMTMACWYVLFVSIFDLGVGVRAVFQIAGVIVIAVAHTATISFLPSRFITPARTGLRKKCCMS